MTQSSKIPYPRLFGVKTIISGQISIESFQFQSPQKMGETWEKKHRKT
jgi:hypothetical protein